MKKFYLSSHIIAFFSLLSGCLISSAVSGQTNVSGIISSGTTWVKAGSPYIITGNTLVASGQTLTIEPGVIVRFDQGKYLKVEGFIKAVGEKNSRIRFTSNSSSPSNGVWEGIQLRPTAGTTFDDDLNYSSGTNFENVDIEYANRAIYVFSTGLRLNGVNFENNNKAIEIRTTDKVIIEDCNINNNTTGIFSEYEVFNDDYVGAIQNTFIRNNNFSGNNTGIYLISNQREFRNLHISSNNFTKNVEAISFGGGGYGPRVHSVYINNNLCKLNTNAIMIKQIYGGAYENNNEYPLQIFENTVVNNTGSSIFFSYALIKGIVRNNIISDNVKGVEIYGNTSSILFEKNSFYNNNFGVQIGYDYTSMNYYVPGGITFKSNSFFTSLNASLIRVFAGSGFVFTGNNFQSTKHVIIRNQTANQVDAKNNYWGTNNEDSINLKIYDREDDFELGKVVYLPNATTPSSDAPVSAPVNVFKRSGTGGVVTVNWNKNPESDIAGYKVYWGYDDATGTFSHVENATDTFFNITAATVRDIIAVTAKDVNATDSGNDRLSGYESGYSFAANYDPPSGLIGKTGPRKVLLSWNVVEGVNMVNIYRKYGNTSFLQIASNVAGNSYTDTALNPSISYTYAVTAVNGQNAESSFSDHVIVQPDRFYWVATNGSNNNTGSFDAPLLNIQYAISQASNADTIILKPGVYVETISFSKIKAVTVASQYLLSKDSSFISETRIEGSSSVANSDGFIRDGLDYYGNARHLLYGLTVQNVSDMVFNLSFADVKKVVIKNNNPSYYFNYSSFGKFSYSTLDSCTIIDNGLINNYTSPITLDSTTINNSVIRNNRTTGLFSLGSNSHILNCSFYSNGSPGINTSASIVSIQSLGKNRILNSQFIRNHCAAVILDSYNDSVILVNNTFYGNWNAIRTTSSNTNAKVFLNNNIIAASQSYDIGVYSYNSRPAMIFKNNILPFGGAGLSSLPNISNIDTTGSENNYNFYPEFVDSANNDFRLSNISPAINRGTLELVRGTDLDGLPKPLPAGSNPDIGAYENASKYAAPKLTRIDAANQKAIVNWALPSAVGLSKFVIYRSTTPIIEANASNLLTDTVSISSYKFVDTGLTNLSTYYYRIKAVDGSGGETGLSNELSVIPDIAPASPEGLIVMKGPRKISLKWDPVAGNGIKYQVFRGTESGRTNLFADSLPSTGFTDTAASAGITYYYNVRALNISGVPSDLSTEVSGSFERVFWVATQGNNNNVGSFDSPLRNIQYAISQAYDGDTIILKPGTYKETVSFSKTKAVTLGSQYLFNKDTSFINATIIDGSSAIDNNNSFFTDTSGYYYYGTSRHSLYGFTIQKVTNSIFDLAYADLKKIVVKNNEGSYYRSMANFSESTIDSCIFRDNGMQTAYYYPMNLGSTFVTNSLISNNRTSSLVALNTGSKIENCKFYQNGVPSPYFGSGNIISLSNSGRNRISNNEFIKNYGAAISLSWYNDSVILASNTFFGNQVAIQNSSYSSYAKVLLNNNIIVGSQYQDFSFTSYYARPAMVFNNNVLGYNAAGLSSLPNVSYIDTSGSANNYGFYPEFVDTANNDFRISASSRAINKGTALFSPATDLLGVPRPLPAGSDPDIGAYETPYNLAGPKIVEAETGDKKVILRWSIPSITGVNKFAVFRSEASINDSVSTGFLTDTISATSTGFIDNGVTNLTKYYYRIKAIGTEVSKTGLSNEVAVVPNIKPAAPENLMVNVAPGRTRLDWSKVPGNAIASYQVFRRKESADQATLMAKNIADTVYVDSAIVRGENYIYTVKAVDTTGGTSFASPEVRTSTTSVWYVDNNGSDSGYAIGSFQYPFKTIEYAYRNTIDRDTLILKPGEYNQGLQSFKLITIGSMYILNGRKGSIDSTVINGTGLNRTLFYQAVYGDTVNRFRLQGLTIKNAQQTAVFLARGGELKNMVLTENGNGSSYYTLVSAFYEAIKIENCTFDNNKSNGLIQTFYNGSTYKVPLLIKNCVFTNNYLPSLPALMLNTSMRVSNVLIAKNRGIAKAISFWNDTNANNGMSDSIWLNHVTVSNNGNSNIMIGGHRNSYLKIVNSIVSHSPATNVIFNNLNASFANYEKPKVVLRNNIISNGIPEINTSYFDTTGSANTYTFEPYFKDTSATYNFSLSRGSSAIGKGLADALNPTTDLNNRSRALPAGSNPDLGAFEDSLATQVPTTLITSITSGNKRDSIYWVQLPDSTSIVRFRLYRDKTPNATTLIADSIPGSAVKFVDTLGLENETTYYYRLRAVDSLGQELDFSNEKSGKPFNRKPQAGVLNNVYVNVNRTYETPVYLSNVGSTDPDGKIDSTAWFVNDVRTAVGSIVQLKLKQGNNKISYVVYDNDGGTDTATSIHSYYATKAALSSGIGTGVSAFNKNNIFYADVVNNLNSMIRVDSLLAPNYSGGPSQLVVNNSVWTSPSVTPDSILFIPNGSSIDAFKINGTPWFSSSAALSSRVQVLPTIDTALKRIYVGLGNGVWQAIQYSSSIPSYPWNFNTKGTGFSSPGAITADRKLVFTTDSGYVGGFDLNNLNEANPQLKWNYRVGAEVKKPLAIDAFGDVVIVDETGAISKLKLEKNGAVSVVWSKKVATEVFSTPVVIDATNNIYCGTNSGKLLKMDSNTGDTIWSYKTNAAIKYSPAISRYGRIYIGNNDGEVHAINIETGLREWYFKPKIPSAISSHLLHIAGATYFTTGSTKEVYQVFDKPEDVSYSARSLATDAKTASLNETAATTKLSDPVWGMFQGDYTHTGQSVATWVQTVYSFVGNGNWSDPTNWENSQVPPYLLTPGNVVIINPATDGECIVDKPVIVGQGASISIKPGKRMRFDLK